MAGRFPQPWLDQFYQQIDIVQIVSGYVQLKRNGKRYIGLCPFHHEKTPSFSVSPDVGLYYCFGCKAGGNAVNFVMEMEHLTYSEAIRFLAEKNQIPLPELEDDPSYEQRKTENERLLAVNRETALFYHRQLWTEQGRQVLEYFHSRGLTDDVIRKFGLGASSNQYQAVMSHLEGLGFQIDEAVKAGVLVQGEKGVHDMFRNRAMFPIIDARGNVLAFGGRAIGDQMPKYLNTSDTPVFNKRLGVFAINLLKKSRGLSRVILVEGYMDVVSLTQFGIEGVVATLGTSLTAEQARLLKRYVKEVWIAYDGDEPGQHAIERAIDIFQQEALPAKVLFFPDGLDPDEFIRKMGKEAFERIIPLSSVEFLMMRAEKLFDLSNDFGRMDYAKACARILRRVQEPVELDHYLTLLSLKTGFSKEVLFAQVGNSTLPAQTVRKTARNRPSTGALKQESESSRAEKMLLALAASGRIPIETVSENDFHIVSFREIAACLKDGKSMNDLLQIYSDQQDKKDILIELISTIPEGMDDIQALQAAQACMNQIRIDQLQKEIQELKSKMSQVSIQSQEHVLYMGDIVNKQKEVSRLKRQADGLGGA